MTVLRVHELARELDMHPRAVLALLADNGVEAKAVASRIDPRDWDSACAAVRADPALRAKYKAAAHANGVESTRPTHRATPAAPLTSSHLALKRDVDDPDARSADDAIPMGPGISTHGKMRKGAVPGANTSGRGRGVTDPRGIDDVLYGDADS